MSKSLNRLITVAIVEDDPMVCRVTQGFLKKVDGYICTNTYSSIDDAKIGLTNHIPMLVLLDVYFAKSSGIELLQWIREKDMDTDIILITADNSSKTIEKAMRYGVIDYLVKPFKLSRFEEALQKYVLIKDEIIKNKNANQEDIDSLMNRSDLELIPNDSSDDLDILEVVEKEKLESNKTYILIRTFLEEHKDKSYTASMIGEKLGVARITARRYLDKMEANHIIELNSEYGTRGRPKNYYRIKR